MNYDEAKRAADAVGRIRALEEALEDVVALPHDALPVRFMDKQFEPLRGWIVAYYPRADYIEVINILLEREKKRLEGMGVTP